MANRLQPHCFAFSHRNRSHSGRSGVVRRGRYGSWLCQAKPWSSPSSPRTCSSGYGESVWGGVSRLSITMPVARLGEPCEHPSVRKWPMQCHLQQNRIARGAY
jgi:hypothetical protein